MRYFLVVIASKDQPQYYVGSIKCLVKFANISNIVLSLMDFFYGRKENQTYFQVQSFKFGVNILLLAVYFF